ncbi:MAG: hypothetical protein J6Y37_16330 [Paludibacteraceae bacterium]|nr:hypothetical protein [Paludibacteraceae bacterium]
MDIERRRRYIEKAIGIHGDVYVYDETWPRTVRDKTTVICRKHGRFETTFDGLINAGNRCPVCAGKYRDTSDYLMRAREVHGDRYDLSKVVYNGSKENVTVTCHRKDEFGNEHGEFSIRASNFIYGTGCPKCGGHYTYTLEEWKARANKVHDGRYDYSMVKSTKVKDKVEIICPVHGSFIQTAGSHLQGCGCPSCNLGVVGNKDDFVERSNAIHHGYYDYSEFVYVNRKTKGTIICPIHGRFSMTPDHHLKGSGCNKCKNSKLENILISRFNKDGILYEYQSRILSIGRKTVDFFLPEYGICIECQGEQHYVPTDFGASTDKATVDGLFAKQVKTDKARYDKALKLGYNMLYFTIPSYFRTEGIDIHGGFYSDKTTFTQVDDLITYIVRQKAFVGANNTFNGFVRDFMANVSSDIVVKVSNMVKCGKFIVHYVPLAENKSDTLNSITRSYKKRGVHVIHVFSDEYMACKDMVMSKIRHIIGLDVGLPKVYGRKCTVRPIGREMASTFLKKNHIQSYARSSIHLGAFCDGEIVGVMSFKDNGNGVYELTRFASSNDKLCCGVGGKLFAYFKSNYEYRIVKSFADKRWTYDDDNNIYVKLGFKKDGDLRPDYHYFDKNIEEPVRLHKFRFRKGLLHRKYWFDMTMTENEMTTKLGYRKVWDCGLIRYVYKKPAIY